MQPLRKTVWWLLRKLKVELPYDPEISPLGIYPQNLKTCICQDIYTLLFIAALFTVTKTWRQLKCPATEDWIKRKWYIYTEEYSSVLRKKYHHLGQQGTLYLVPHSLPCTWDWPGLARFITQGCILLLGTLQGILLNKGITFSFNNNLSTIF